LNAFQSRFSELADHAENIALFTNPFNFPEKKTNIGLVHHQVPIIEENLQLDIIDLEKLICRDSCHPTETVRYHFTPA